MAGVVTLVASPEEVLSVETVGYADLSTKEAMKPDAVFWIASMTVPMTATAVMVLVDDGKLRLDDRVEKFLPELRVQMVAASPSHGKDHGGLVKPKQRLKIRHLLTHTGGLTEFRTPGTPRDRVPLRDAVRFAAQSPLKFEPGSKCEYSNIGIDVLGRVVEVVSRMPYERFMEKRLFRPLGMKDTTFWPSDEQLRRLPQMYKPGPRNTGLEAVPKIGFFTYPLGDRRRQPFPAAGLFSTAADVSIFCRMFLQGGQYEGHRYLVAETVRQMTSTQTEGVLGMGDREQGCGFGWMTMQKARTNEAGPSGPYGYHGAYGTWIWISPPHKLVMLLMSQLTGQSDGDIRDMRLAFGGASHKAFPVVLPKPAPPPAEKKSGS